MNCMDTLLLLDFALLCYVMSSNLQFTMLIFVMMLLLIPIAVFIPTPILKLMKLKVIACTSQT